MVNHLLIQNFLNTFQVRKTEKMKVTSRLEVNSIWNNMNKLPCYKYLNFRLHEFGRNWRPDQMNGHSV